MKKKSLSLLSLAFVGTLALGVFLVTPSEAAQLSMSAAVEYGMAFDSSTNKLFAGTGSTDHSGSSVLKTQLGNDITFTYNTVAGGSSSNWHLIKDGGFFCNSDPIHGIKELNVTCTAADKTYKVYWGNTLDYALGNTTVASKSTGDTIDFGDEYPTYFKFENVSGSNISIRSMSLTWSCENNYPTLTVSSENAEFGTVSGDSGVIRAGSNATIVATPNAGYSFVGWYDSEDQLVSDLATYTFTMPHGDLAYTAKFAQTQHSLTLTVNDASMGSVTGGGSYVYNQQVTLTATPNEHYSFFGWYDGETLLSQEATYSFAMPDNSLSYEARFVRNYGLTVYSDDESMGTVTAPSEWGAGLQVTVVADANDGYSFDYWANADYDEVAYTATYAFTMPSEEVELIAVFSARSCVSLVSNNEERGTVSGSGNYKPGTEATVTAAPSEGYLFGGWYSDEGLTNKVSASNPYTFTIPDSDVSLYAAFWTEEEWREAGGILVWTASTESLQGWPTEYSETLPETGWNAAFGSTTVAMNGVAVKTGFWDYESYIIMGSARCNKIVSYFFNTAALSKAIASVELTTTSSVSAYAMYHVSFGTAALCTPTDAEGTNIGKSASYTFENTTVAGATYFQIAQTNVEKNGQIAKIVVTFAE